MHTSLSGPIKILYEFYWKMEVIKGIVFLIFTTLFAYVPHAVDSTPDYIINNHLRLHTQPEWNFYVTWQQSRKTLYTGNSLSELLKICPQGCTNTCKFPSADSPAPAPCEAKDIKALRRAQKIGKEWDTYFHISHVKVALRSIPPLIIIVLVILLIVFRHYRVRDLWYLPPERQWESETDPTWGLPGNVYRLRASRVTKSKKKGQSDSDRKYSSYTENPIEFKDKFWYYKQSLRDMYKTTRHYKRKRYFHKLSWQYVKLHKVIPETLRKHKKRWRKTAEVEEIDASSSEEFQMHQLPVEVSFLDEVSIATLDDVKTHLKYEISKARAAGFFHKGRYTHHLRNRNQLGHLTKSEVDLAAKDMDIDPNPDWVNVDGQMRRKPESQQQGKHHHHTKRASEDAVKTDEALPKDKNEATMGLSHKQEK